MIRAVAAPHHHVAALASERRHLRLAMLAVVVTVGLVWTNEATAQSVTVVSTPSLTITTASAGNPPSSVSGNGSIQISTGLQTRYKLMARLNSELAAGVTLSLKVSGQGTTLETKVLTTTDQDMVRDLPSMLVSANATVAYTLAATSAAGVLSSSASVVLTVVSY